MTNPFAGQSDDYGPNPPPPNDVPRPVRFREVGEWDWWIVDGGAVLHCADVRYDEAIEVGGLGTSSCGIRSTYWIPGLFTRMDAPRCRRCCRATGFPPGNGSPKNDAQCRPRVERRLMVAAGRG